MPTSRLTRNLSQGGTCLGRASSIGIPKMGLTRPVLFPGPLDSGDYNFAMEADNLPGVFCTAVSVGCLGGGRVGAS